MRVGTPTGAGRTLVPLVIAILLGCLAPLSASAETSLSGLRSYCNAPPVDGFKPNLLLMMDNSSSMYDLAYTDNSQYCLDDSYGDSGDYPGYFDQSANYRYNFADSRFEPYASPMPSASSCNTVRKDFLCLNLSNASAYPPTRTVDRFVASGRFLNWLLMSKLDIEKKALTGGRYDPATGLMLAESRGCQGKRFIKLVGDARVTFAVRGPIPAESDFVYRASYGGLTRVEIYPARYNTTDCLAAISAWQGGSLQALSRAALGCLGSAEYDDFGSPSRARVYSEIMSDCSGYQATGHTDPALDATLSDDCSARVAYSYGEDASQVPQHNGDDVCAKGIYHAITTHDSKVYSSGYLGECFQLGSGISPAGSCSKHAIIDFCNQVSAPTVTDPSVSALRTGTGAGLPSFVLDAGVIGLGEPAGTLTGRLSAAEPRGLIQEFSSSINFGALVFNDNGAGSECGDGAGQIPCLKHCSNANDPIPHKECYRSVDCDADLRGSGTCQEDPRTDGGRIISYLNYSPVGDHRAGSGLIASLDAVRADSWTPLSEAFYQAIGYFANRPELRLQNSDFDPALPPIRFSCQKNGILMVTDGMSTADRAPAVIEFVKGAQGFSLPSSQTTTDPAAADPPNGGSYNLDDLAWLARNKNIANPALPVRNVSDYLTTHVVYTGPPCGSYLADGSCATNDELVPEKMMQLTAAKGGGALVNVRKPGELERALRGMLKLIGSSASSGTDSALLLTGSGNGAVFLQEQFYPTKSFDGGGSAASWIGEMQGLWYYIDPFLAPPPGKPVGEGSSIREDSDGDLTLNLAKDRIVAFSYAANKPQAQLYQDLEGDGGADLPAGGAIDTDQVKSLWRAGRLLWSRDLSAAPRSIYTPLVPGGSEVAGTGLMKLSVAAPDNATPLVGHLQAADAGEAKNLVRYLQGYDFPDYPGRPAGEPVLRSRTLRIGALPGPSISTDPASPYLTNPRDKGIGVWKLGDIVSSTPVLQSPAPLGTYHLPPLRGYGDPTYRGFLSASGSTGYPRRGTVYLGANDGMLHAFRLGGIAVQPPAGESWPQAQKAVLSAQEPGWEEWAFVPGNALPYLRLLKEPAYSHLYLVDGGVTLVDASLGDPATCSRAAYWNCPKDPAGGSWRSVLIGGMGLGGGSRGAGASCAEGSSGTCVKAPMANLGLSSYFALDITGQNREGSGPPPRLLWEFAPPGLGFATSGAAILKLNAPGAGGPGDPPKNGRWFAVFASGPTGPIDPGSCQFLGRSDQNLKLFVVDLNALPPLAEGVNYWVIDTGIPSAFGGSLAGAGIDTDRFNPAAPGFYQDDALYLGYTRKGDDGTWSEGGVLRLLTGEDPDPRRWRVSRVIDGTGPVTGAVAKLQDRGSRKLWLYFGSGRYFYNQDDMGGRRSLYGVKEPCYGAENALSDDGVCSAAPIAVAALSNATDPVPADPAAPGWRIGLDPPGSAGGERALGTPVPLTNGSVFFTSYQPSGILCEPGTSYLWGVRYDSGGMTAAAGSALVSLSNGSSIQAPLSGWSDRGGRRSPPMTGRPAGVKLVTNAGLKPLKKIIHIQER